MILTRTYFFLLLFLVIVAPWLIPKTIWLATSAKAKGSMEFIGHGNLGSVLGMTTYPVIRFDVGGREFHFNGNMNIPLEKGQAVEVRYQKSNPNDARINSFGTIWGDTLAYVAGPFLFFIVLLLSPSIVPRRSKVRIGLSPLIQIMPTAS